MTEVVPAAQTGPTTHYLLALHVIDDSL